MAASGIVSSLMRHFRRSRMRKFERLLAITPRTRVLDIGGTPLNWSYASVHPRVTVLNLPHERVDSGYHWAVGDARRLPFADGSFDVVFSNSVIEHVGGLEDQRRFAREVMRAGKCYWVQTPNRWFPVEQHLLTPLVHFLPLAWQRAIVPRFSFWTWIARPRADQQKFFIEHYLKDVRLLDARAVRELFPDAIVIRERFLGLTKSLIAARLP